MRIAHQILAHKTPAQIIHLTETLLVDDDIVLIHLCKNMSEQDVATVQNHFVNNDNVICSKRFYGNWGDNGIVEAVFAAIEHLQKHNIYYDYFNVISAQDYLIQPISALKDYLKQHLDTCFIVHWPIIPNGNFSEDHPWKEGGLHRLKKRRFKWGQDYFAIPEPHYMGHSVWRNLKIFIYETPALLKSNKWRRSFKALWLSILNPKDRALPTSWTPYGGSQWFTIPQKAANHLISFYQSNPKIRAFFRQTILFDEKFAATALLNSDYQSRCVHNNLRLIEFNTGTPHPAVYTLKDYDHLIQSGQFFTRKIEWDSGQDLIQQLDQKLNLRGHVSH